MINPTAGTPQGAPFSAANNLPPEAPPPVPNTQKVYTVSIEEPEDQQKAIVSALVTFKRNAVQNARMKKEVMRRCYSYSKSKLTNGDLLPLPSTNGSQNDAKTDRPQIFMPATRQNLKTINSQLKLTIFPNDTDYFRIRAKKPEGMPLEDSLTEGMKYLFQQSNISEKLGGCLWDACWSGFFAAFPKITQTTITEWQIVPGVDENGNETMSYMPNEYKTPPLPDVESWNPLNFYIDPNEPDPERSKWVYIDRIKKRDIADSPIYINKEKIDGLASKNFQNTSQSDYFTLAVENDLSNYFNDAEDSVDYCFYYFPYLKVNDKEYRNFVAGVVADQVLVRFHPNIFPKGLNPAVFTGWMHDPRNPYSQGPAEDMMHLQKLMNILENFKLEDMARGANKYVATPNANFQYLHGVAGGIIISDDPTRDVVQLPYNPTMANHITNEIGVLKAEAQTVAGSQNPFQGSSNIDFKKTATEMQLLQEQYISILREVIQHLTSMGIERVFERLMYLIADTYQTPLTVPVNRPMGGREYIQVDFSPLKSGDFTIELVGANPAQSKQAQVQSIMQIVGMISSPEDLMILEPVIQRLGVLNGIKDIDQILQEVKERIGMMNEQQRMQQAGMGAGSQQPMEGVAPPKVA